MKKYLFSLLALLAMTFTVVTLTSCGDDDNSNGGGTSGGGTSSALVGTWQCTYPSGSKDVVVLNSNNTGSTAHYSSNGSIEESFSFSYVVSGNTLRVYPEGNVDSDIITLFTIVSTSTNTIVLNNGESDYTYTRVSGGSDNSGNTGGNDSGSTTNSLVGAYNWSYTSNSKMVVESIILNSNNTGKWTAYDHNGNINETGTFNWSQSGSKLNLTWTSNGSGAPNQITIQSQSTTSITINDGSKTITMTKVSDGSNNTAYSNIVGNWRISSYMQKRYTNGVEGSLYVNTSEDQLIITEDGVIRYNEKGSSGNYHFDGISLFVIRNGSFSMQQGFWLGSITINSLTSSEMDVEMMEAPEVKGSSTVQDWYRFMCYKM